MKQELLTWTALNNALRGLTRERDVLALLPTEDVIDLAQAVLALLGER